MDAELGAVVFDVNVAVDVNVKVTTIRNLSPVAVHIVIADAITPPLELRLLPAFTTIAHLQTAAMSVLLRSPHIQKTCSLPAQPYTHLLNPWGSPSLVLGFSAEGVSMSHDLSDGVAERGSRLLK